MNTKGQGAESVAAKYLNAQGLKLITRNYRSRFGKIDFIMQDGASLVFIEVRLRKNNTKLSSQRSIICNNTATKLVPLTKC